MEVSSRESRSINCVLQGCCKVFIMHSRKTKLKICYLYCRKYNLEGNTLGTRHNGQLLFVSHSMLAQYCFLSSIFSASIFSSTNFKCQYFQLAYFSYASVLFDSCILLGSSTSAFGCLYQTALTNKAVKLYVLLLNHCGSPSPSPSLSLSKKKGTVWRTIKTGKL